MITLTKGQLAPNKEQAVVNAGDYNEEDNVLVVNGEGQESYLQAYFIMHGTVYAEKTE